MKKLAIVSLLISFYFILSISACKKNDEPQEIKVAMLAQGNTFDDLSFLQSCKTGMEIAKSDFNLIVDYDAENSTDNYSQRISNYINNDYNLIIAIGFMWNDAVVEAAKMYPNTKFILVDTQINESQSNVVSIIFNVDEVAFPIGFLSAWWADARNNPSIAYVAALDIPQIRQFTDPFVDGATYFNNKYSKSVSTNGVFLGDFFNKEKGIFLSDSLINNGAEVIFGVGSETGIGALIGAQQNNKWAMGADSDQYYSVPEVSDILISSAMKRLDNSIYDVVKSYVDNTFDGGSIYKGNLANNGVAMAPFHNFDQQIADSIKTELEFIKQEIINGNLNTNGK